MKKKILNTSVVVLIPIILIVSIYQCNQNIRLKREVGAVYKRSISYLKINTDFMIDYLSNDEVLNKERIDFYATKLNELKVIELPPNIAINGYVSILYSNFATISEKLKIGELKIKEGKEISYSIKVLKLLKQVLEKIEKQYGDNDFDYYKLGNPKNRFTDEVNAELVNELNILLNGDRN